MRLGRAGWGWGAGVTLVALGVLVLSHTGRADEPLGWFGIRIRDLSEREMEDLSIKLGLMEGYGVVVSEVLPDAPASASGLRAGDLIVAIEDRPVVETRGLQRIVGSTLPGAELRVLVLREGHRREVRVPVGAMPGDLRAERVAAEFGFLVGGASPGNLTPDASRPLVVAAVAERSPADRGGLRVGDRIVAVAGIRVASVEAYRQHVVRVSLREELELRVRREGAPLTLRLPPAWWSKDSRKRRGRPAGDPP